MQLNCFDFSDMLAYGCTRLEIGVQSVYEDVARDTNRLVDLVECEVECDECSLISFPEVIRSKQ